MNEKAETGAVLAPKGLSVCLSVCLPLTCVLYVGLYGNTFVNLTVVFIASFLNSGLSGASSLYNGSVLFENCFCDIYFLKYS